MAVGRPRKIRHPSSGQKLLHAMKLCGLTWGNRTDQKNHVLNTERWIQFDLPRSANTIVSDIREGIPQDRIVRYAKFFNVDPMLFSDDDIVMLSKDFESKVLQSRYQFSTNACFPVLEIDKFFCHKLYEKNDPDNVAKFFMLISGVYMFYINEVTTNEVCKCALSVNDQKQSFLLGDGYMKMFGLDILIKFVMFKWSTFLHINYYTQDGLVVGYMVAQDPCSSPYLQSRNPLKLELFGVSGSIVSTGIPDRFQGYAEKCEIPAGVGQANYYAALCDEIAASPTINSQSPTFSPIWNQIMDIKDRSPFRK